MMVMKSTLSIRINVVTKIFLQSACWILTLGTPAVGTASDAGGLASSLGSTSTNAPVGTEDASSVASNPKEKTKLQQLNDYVSALGAALLAASDYSGEDFKFEVWEDPMVNASTDGKKTIHISTGIMLRMNSEAELAAVLSHEIMHNLKEHRKRSERRGKIKNALGQTAAMVLGRTSESRREIWGAMQDVNELAFTQFDQNQEYEADLYGAELLTKAGFEPTGVVEMLRTLNAESSLEFKRSRLEERKNREERSFAKSHPPTPERMARAQQKVEDLLQQGTDRQDKEMSEVGMGLSDDQFLLRLNGISYEPLNTGTVFRGGRFYHSQYQMKLAFPDGWRHKQKGLGSSAVHEFVSITGDAAFEVSNMRFRFGMTPESFATERLGLQVKDGYNLTIGGFPAYIGIAERAQTLFGERPVRFVIAFDPLTEYAFVGQGSGKFDLKKLADDGSFIKIGFSLARMQKADFEAAKPLQLKVVRASPGTTMASLAAQSDLPNYPEDELRVINGLYPQGEPEPGQLIKIID